MNETRSAYDVLSHASWRQMEIDKAVDQVTESHARLAEKQEGFARVWQEVEDLMKVNPTVEAVEAGNGKVVVRLPSGGLTILTVTPWHALKLPVCEPIPTIRNNGSFSIPRPQLDSLNSYFEMAETFDLPQEESEE